MTACRHPRDRRGLRDIADGPRPLCNEHFARFPQLSENAARAIAEGLWGNIDLKNLRENILPTRPRSDLILRKGADHLIEEVALRKL